MKKIMSSFLLLVIIISLTACKGTNEKMDITELATDLINNVEFEDEMTNADDGIVTMLYNIDFAVNQQIYISSGATAEEIAVFELKDDKDADKAYENATQRIADQKDAFENYIPKEVQKLNSAIVKNSGNYVIVCVSDDDKAKDIISKYTK